jgi:hypothetical protein
MSENLKLTRRVATQPSRGAKVDSSYARRSARMAEATKHRQVPCIEFVNIVILQVLTRRVQPSWAVNFGLRG